MLLENLLDIEKQCARSRIIESVISPERILLRHTSDRKRLARKTAGKHIVVRNPI